MKYFSFTAIVFLLGISLVSCSKIYETNHRDGSKEFFSRVESTLLANPPNGGDSVVREEIILELDNFMKNDDCRTNADFVDFYNLMMNKVAQELSLPVSSGFVIWAMYNHGFIVRTSDTVFAFDLVHCYSGWYSQYSVRLPDSIINSIDVLFVSHSHGDHYSTDIVSRVIDNGGYVFYPSGESISGNMPVNNGEIYNQSGLSITAHAGVHSIPVMIFEVVTGDGYKFVHTGDNQSSEFLPVINDAEILFINCWVNESGLTSNVEGIRNSIEKIPSDILIPGHMQELWHSAASRYTYESVYMVDDVQIIPILNVMFWGEMYRYP